MPDMSLAELASLPNREYIVQVKLRLRNDEAWLTVLDPRLAGRTRWALSRIIQSIDQQRLRVERDGTATDSWLRSVESLRRYAKDRLDKMPLPEEVTPHRSANREAKAWRAFSATLARRLAQADPESLEVVLAPYGGLTAAQWLSARDEKRKAGKP